MAKKILKEKLNRLFLLMTFWLLFVSAISIMADVDARNPAMLILPNFIQKDSPVYSSPRRGASLPDKKLMDYIRREKGFVLEVGAFSPKLDMAFLKQFNLAGRNFTRRGNPRLKLAVTDTHSGREAFAAPAFVAHFYDLMSGNGTPYSPVDQAFAAEMIALAAYQSNIEGSFIHIEDMLPEDMKKIFRRSFDK